VRLHAVWWLSMRGLPGRADTAPPALLQRAMPALCDLARNDPQLEVREAVIDALANAAIFSEEVLQIMLVELNHTHWHHREAAARWFGRTTPDERRVVPLLVRGLEETQPPRASSRRRWGPRARFVVEPLDENYIRIVAKAVRKVAKAYAV
jgi:hypothetical protein